MTEQERLEYLNEYLEMDYTSLEDVDWLFVSIISVLSEDFIRIFQDKVVWHRIVEYQELSDEFKEEFKDKIEESKLIYAQKRLITETEKLGYALNEFIYLPNLEADLKSTSLEDDYNPTLYKYDGLWCVDWISSEGDSIKTFEHEDIIEVIKQASQWINENFCDSGD